MCVEGNENYDMKKGIHNIKWIAFIAILFLCLLSLQISADAKASKVKLSDKSITLLKGNTDTLKVSGITKKTKVKWTSSKPKVAAVTQKGVVKAKAKGSAVITAKVDGKKYTCKVKVQTPTLSTKSLKLIQGDTYLLKLTGTTKKISWKSSKASVAKVSSNGKVTAKKAGTATIKASVDGKAYTCKLKVIKKKPITTVSLNKTKLIMNKGVTAALKLTYKPLATTDNTTITWSSNNTSVAKVSSKGKVSAVDEGTAVITAKIAGKKVTCKVIVQNIYQGYDFTGSNIPDYWRAEMSDSLDTIGQYDMQISSHSAEFLFFTDIHWNGNAQNSPYLMNYLVKQLKIPVLCGGDIVTHYHESKSDAIKEVRNFYSKLNMPIFMTIGNHDDNGMQNPDQSSEAIFSDSQMYSLYLRQEESLAYTASDDKYAYFDNTSQKVRFISFMYTGYEKVDSSITNWVDERIAELSEDWTVCLMSHAYWSPIDSSTGLERELKKESVRLAEHFVKLESNVDAEIACWLVGHVHRDLNQMISDENGNNLLIISTNCDAYKKSEKEKGLPMKAGTDTEQVIDAFQIDLKTRQIYITRIGAGTDRQFTY